MVKYVWDAQGIIDDDIKKATLVSAFQDHALTWYMKYSSDHPTESISAIQEALNKEFRLPKVGSPVGYWVQRDCNDAWRNFVGFGSEVGKCYP